MSFPIGTPAEFTNNAPTDTINFNADVPTNKIENFVTTSAGDLLYRDAGGSNYLARLPIGAPGQVLTPVGGLPAWGASSAVGGQSMFTANITGSLAGIPTSRAGGLDPGTWFPLYGVAPGPFVTWTDVVDPDSVFNTAAGVTYGTFTAPATGYYYFSTSITFDSGVGVTAGVGLPAASLPSGKAVRQLRVFNITAAAAISTFSRQVEASNSNGTTCPLVVEACSLTAGDRVGLQVRHDRSSTNTVTIGDGAISVPTQSYFSGMRIR